MRLDVTQALADSRALRHAHSADHRVHVAVSVADVIDKVVKVQWPTPADRTGAGVGFFIVSAAIGSMADHPEMLGPEEWMLATMFAGERAITGDLL